MDSDDDEVDEEEKESRRCVRRGGDSGLRASGGSDRGSDDEGDGREIFCGSDERRCGVVF